MCEITNDCNLIIKGNSDEIKYSTTLKGEKLNSMYFFTFNDGEEAIFTNDKAGVKNLQEFLDLMNKTHILQKQLDIAINTLKRIKTQSELYFQFEEESSTNCDSYATERSIYDLSLKSLNQIKELNK